MKAGFCSEQLIKSCKWEVKEKREGVHPGMGGDLKHGTPKWQPSVLIMLYENIINWHLLIKSYKLNA